MDASAMTPEEYAAQLANALANGQNAPGLTPGPSIPVPPTDPAAAYYAAWQNRVAPPPIPAVGAPVGPPVAGVADLPNPDLGGASPNDLAAQAGNPAPTIVPRTLPPPGSPQVIPTPFPTAPQGPAGAQGMPPGGMSMPGFGFPASEAVAAQGAQALQREGEAKAAMGADQAEALRRQQVEAQQLQNYQSQARAEMNSEIDKQAQDIANQKIDPKRLWNSKSDGERAASLIGIVLSGIGSGLTGGPNMALQVIDRQIERDINAQTAELGKKENLLSALYRKYGNLEQAQGVARIFKTEAFARELQTQAAQHGGEAEKAHADFMGTQLRAGIAAQKDQFANQMGMMRWQMTMVGGAGGGAQYENGQHATRPEGFDLAAFAKASNVDKGRALPPRAPGGLPVLAHNESAATDARNRLVGIKGAHELLQQIEQERGPGNIVPWSNDQVATETKLRALAVELARAQTGGIPHEAIIDDSMKMLRGPFMAYVRGKGSYKPVEDVLDSQKNAIYRTFAPGTPEGITTPYTKVR